MIRFAVYAMVYLGSALMIFNIYGFVRFAGFVRSQNSWKSGSGILYVPIALLVMFFLGYLGVGLFGNPDLLVSGILFGGSIFVFVVYILLSRITRRLLENERLQSELMAAERSNRAKTEFLASMSHEMRTPMNVILGLDTLALRNDALPEDTRDKLKKIGHSARHLLQMINNLLDMNSMTEGSFAVRKEAFSLGEVIDQVCAITSTVCEQKGLTFDFSCDDAARGEFLGDALQIKHVLLSVLDNAAKYTEAPGEVTFDVSCAPGENGETTAIFAVSDTGVGIDSEFLPHLFEAFTREDAGTTARYGGTGMSLAIGKRIVDLLGGTIRVESEKNVGSTFTVTVPLASAPEKKPTSVSASAEEKERPSYESASLEGRRILIVEDIPENAEIAADLLELEGASSERAENGQIGLEMVQKAPPGYYDAILMDLRMPVMDGLECTRRIRALEREDMKTIPILALTANAYPSDVEQTFAAGMDAHLAKPTDSDKMYETLRALIGKNERRAER